MLVFVFYFIFELKFPHKKRKKQIETVNIRAAATVFTHVAMKCNTYLDLSKYLLMYIYGRRLFPHDFYHNSLPAPLSSILLAPTLARPWRCLSGRLSGLHDESRLGPNRVAVRRLNHITLVENKKILYISASKVSAKLNILF